MLSLSSNFSDVLKRTGSAEIRPLVKLTGRQQGSPYSTKDFYLSTQYFEITDSGTTYPVEGILESTPKTQEKINLKQHTASYGGFTLQISDLPGSSNNQFSEQFDDYYFYNRTVEVYLWIEGLTDLSYCLQVYAGLMGSASRTGNNITIPIENSTRTKQKTLPQNYLNTTDYSTLEDAYKNTPIPIVYGEFTYTIDATNPSTVQLDREVSLAPCVPINTAGETKKFMVAGHGMTDLSTDDVFVFDAQTQRLYQVQPSQITVNNTDGNGYTTIDLATTDNEWSVYDWWFPTGGANRGVNDIDWTNPDQAGDVDITSTAEVSVDRDADPMFIAGVDISFNEYNSKEFESVDAVELFARTNYILIGGNDAAVNYTLALANIKSNDETTIENVTSIASPGYADIGDSVTVQLDDNVGGDTYVVTAECYEVYKRISLSFVGFDASRFTVCVRGKGRPDDGSGTITGTPNGIIENPSHIGESILRDELGLSTDINTTAFDNVATELTSWVLAPVYTAEQNSLDLLQDLARQAKSFLWWDAGDQVAMDTFYSTETTDYTGIKKSDVNMGSLDIYESPLKDLVNELRLTYRRNYPAQKNAEVITRADDTSDTGSQDVYNAVMEKEMQANHIIDTTTAGLLADHWTQDAGGAFWSDVYTIVEFETVDLRGTNYWQSGSFTPLLTLELNDVIEFDDTDWDEYLLCLGESWSGKQFKIFEITRNLTTLKIKAFEV